MSSNLIARSNQNPALLAFKADRNCRSLLQEFMDVLKVSSGRTLGFELKALPKRDHASNLFIGEKLKYSRIELRKTYYQMYLSDTFMLEWWNW